MKTLSIQQPWASMICAGIKDVENRTWKAAHVPGRILIHASSKKVTKNFNETIPECWESQIANHQLFGNLPEYQDMPTSAIIGYATVTEFAEETDSIWDGGTDIIKWKLEDAWLFDKPILNVKGKLNLFDYPLDENCLPSAHQVQLRKTEVEGENVVLPVTDEIINQVEELEDKFIQMYFTENQVGAICKEKETGELVPLSTITLVGESKQAAYQLNKEETKILAIPDIEDETKPYIIHYPDGTEGQWQYVQFVLGEKI